MSKLKVKLKKLQSYSRLLRKGYLREKMPFSFIKMCFVCGIEFGHYKYHILKALAHNGFEFAPKNTQQFNAKDDEIRCENKTTNLRFNLSLHYPWIANEIFNAKIYNFPKSIHALLFGKKQQYVLLDIGCNRGYASLYFALQDWCKKIFAFELFPETCKQARQNLKLNPALESKITFCEYGLSSKEILNKAHKINGGGGIIILAL